MAKFVEKVRAGDGAFPFHRYDSELEVPKSGDAKQNAWLTLHLWLKLEYCDRQNFVSGIITRDGNKFQAKDSDGDLYDILDWDDKSKAEFELAFLEAEKAWNFQFLLTTPKNYDQLDFQSRDLRYLVRPNVLGLFRLHINRPYFTTTIRVVRLDHSGSAWKFLGFVRSASQFRSHSQLYKDADVADETVGHELGHALGQSHIAGLNGVETCTIGKKTGNDGPCYGRNKEEKSNRMGSGDQLALVNAVSWTERMVHHCPGTKPQDWVATRAPGSPPRTIPIGVSLVGPLPAF